MNVWPRLVRSSSGSWLNKSNMCQMILEDLTLIPQIFVCFSSYHIFHWKLCREDGFEIATHHLCRNCFLRPHAVDLRDQVYENLGVRSEVPDSQHSTSLNKSQQSPKIADGCQSNPSPAAFTCQPSLFSHGSTGPRVSPTLFSDKQIKFLLKQAAAVPFDNNVIIQNKWFSSLMRALLWVTKTHTDICLILSPWTLSSSGKFIGSDRSSVLKPD